MQRMGRQHVRARGEAGGGRTLPVTIHSDARGARTIESNLTNATHTHTHTHTHSTHSPQLSRPRTRARVAAVRTFAHIQQGCVEPTKRATVFRAEATRAHPQVGVVPCATAGAAAIATTTAAATSHGRDAWRLLVPKVTRR